MELSRLNGLPVLTVQGAEELGSVDDAEFDAGQQQIVALRVNMKGIFSGHKVVTWSSVTAVGDQAVTVQDADVLGDDHSGGQSLNDVVGSKVVTVGGQEVGTVGDVDFDATSGKIQDFVLKGGMLDRLQHRQDVLPVAWVQSIGDHLIVVNEGTSTST